MVRDLSSIYRERDFCTGRGFVCGLCRYKDRLCTAHKHVGVHGGTYVLYILSHIWIQRGTYVSFMSYASTWRDFCTA